jgi:lysophospholipase L1-like esterase
MSSAHPVPARRSISIALTGLVVALGAAFGVLAASPGAADAQPAGAPAPGSQYVALGDSYAAGYGIGSSTGQPVAGCAQSTQDYPHQIAAKLKLKLTDVSCSGAVAANIDTTPQDTGGGTAPLQDKALSKTTKLVTVTIGGNDLGFADIAQYCLAGSASGPLLLHPTELNCQAHYDPNNVDSLAATTSNTVVPHVARVLADIAKKAPNAAVYFVDYPAISTTKAGSPNPAANPPSPAAYPNSCYSSPATAKSFPFTGTDTVYLQGVQANLNASLKTRVAKSGDRFVESYPQSLTHSACAGTADPWLNGVTVDLQTFGAAPGSLHPNLEGAQHLAAEALAAIGPYVAPSTRSAAGPRPTGNSPAANTFSSLANTGNAYTVPMTVTGALLVLGGALLLLLTRTRHSTHSG